MTEFVRTRIEVFINGHKVVEVTDTEPPEPDLHLITKDAIYKALTSAQPRVEDEAPE